MTSQHGFEFDAPADAVFDALTTVNGLSAWWTRATGSGTEGGELRLVFGEDKVAHADTARRPSTAAWTVRERFLPEWISTRPTFMITPRHGGGCELQFRHRSLSAHLECYDHCRQGRHYYLPRLRERVESTAQAAIAASRGVAHR
jgi:uncharacterized protein YndB with AHSA1/START domain